MQKGTPLRARNIVLMGMPGVGKTTLGRVLAFRTNREFVDFDQFIEKQSGKTIREIFETEGEAGFRAHERKCLHKIGTRRGMVVAVGGGTLCNPSNLRYARSLGILVSLTASVQTIAQRVFAEQGKRPLFGKASNETEAEAIAAALLESRQKYYECADFLLETDFSSIDNLILQLFFIEDHTHEVFRERKLPELILEGLSPQEQERFAAEHQKFSNEGRPAPALPSDFVGTDEHFASRFPVPRQDCEGWNDVVWRDSLFERSKRDDRRDASKQAQVPQAEGGDKKKRRKKKKKKPATSMQGAQQPAAGQEAQQEQHPRPELPRPQPHRNEPHPGDFRQGQQNRHQQNRQRQSHDRPAHGPRQNHGTPAGHAAQPPKPTS
jgi:shikimate kinase